MRKTGKFTAAQNKEEKGDFVDSVGELVNLCEQQGFIPRFATDVPQDKIDATLKDQKDYIYKLVTEDLGFGQQIEDALKRLEVQRQLEEEEREKLEALGEDYEPYYGDEITPKEADTEEEIEDIRIEPSDAGSALEE